MADGARNTIIAVDFDGCLCENAWPKIGEPKQNIIDALLEKQKNGAKLILWTCRVEGKLTEAISWCAARGLFFDAINANLEENIEAFGNDCRKVFADEYWDDKAVPISPMLHICPDNETAKRVSDERIAPMKLARPTMPGGKIVERIEVTEAVPSNVFVTFDKDDTILLKNQNESEKGIRLTKETVLWLGTVLADRGP